jgi:hypothetical protein
MSERKSRSRIPTDVDFGPGRRPVRNSWTWQKGVDIDHIVIGRRQETQLAEPRRSRRLCRRQRRDGPRDYRSRNGRDLDEQRRAPACRIRARRTPRRPQRRRTLRGPMARFGMGTAHDPGPGVCSNTDGRAVQGGWDTGSGYTTAGVSRSSVVLGWGTPPCHDVGRSVDGRDHGVRLGRVPFPEDQQGGEEEDRRQIRVQHAQ